MECDDRIEGLSSTASTRFPDGAADCENTTPSTLVMSKMNGVILKRAIVLVPNFTWEDAEIYKEAK